MIGLIVQNLCAIYGPALMAMIFDSLPPENRGGSYSLQSVITSLVLLPGPLIAQYLIFVFHFDLGMRIAYTIMLLAYFGAAAVRLKLKETLLPNAGLNRPNLWSLIKTYPQSVKASVYVWQNVPKSAFNLFLAIIIIINGLVVSCQTYFVVYATLVLGIATEQWAIIVTFQYLSIAVPVIIAGFTMDRFGRKKF